MCALHANVPSFKILGTPLDEVGITYHIHYTSLCLLNNQFLIQYVKCRYILRSRLYAYPWVVMDQY